MSEILSSVLAFICLLFIFWSLLSDPNDSDVGTGFIGGILFLPMIAMVIAALLFVLPFLLSVLGIVAAVLLLGAMAYFFWKPIQRLMSALLTLVFKSIKILIKLIKNIALKILPSIKALKHIPKLPLKLLKGLSKAFWVSAPFLRPALKLVSSTMKLLRKALKAPLGMLKKLRKTLGQLVMKPLILVRSLFNKFYLVLWKSFPFLRPILRSMRSAVQKLYWLVLLPFAFMFGRKRKSNQKERIQERESESKSSSLDVHKKLLHTREAESKRSLFHALWNASVWRFYRRTASKKHTQSRKKKSQSENLYLLGVFYTATEDLMGILHGTQKKVNQVTGH